MSNFSYTSCHPFDDLQSPFAHLFIAIQERIKESVPDIVWCDLWWGQETLELRPAVAFPALLIDFPAANFSAEAQDSLWASISVNMKLLCAPFSASEANAPEQARADALRHYEIEHRIIEAIHCWTPPGDFCQSLTITGIATDNRHPELRIRTLSFSTAYELDILT